MTKTQIEKILNLLNNNNIPDAKQLLTIELLKLGGSKNVKLIDTIKKYFKSMDDSRPVLKTIMVRNGRQFICSDFSMYIFENYNHDLDVLPQTTENTLDYTQIILKNPDYKDIDSHDLKVLKNIKKIIDYYKQINGVDKKNKFIIPFANKYYDAKMILELCNMYQHNFDDLKIHKTDNPVQLTQFTDNNITGVILPVRVPDGNDAKLYDERLNNFFSLLDEI